MKNILNFFKTTNLRLYQSILIKKFLKEDKYLKKKIKFHFLLII